MKIAIIGSPNFQPVYMVKNYISSLYLLHRPFNFFDPEYDEEINIITNMNNLTEVASTIAAGLEGFTVTHLPLANLIEQADKIVVFWDGTCAVAECIIHDTLEAKKNLEVYFSPKEK